MDVQTGKDKILYIEKNILNEICLKIRKYHYETGGIIGTNEKGVIAAFQFDEIQTLFLHEYYPNVGFLNRIVNEKWKEKNITFVGFIHSHLHNDNLSQQDVVYAREILKVNSSLDEILIGIINLSVNSSINWYLIS